MNTVGRTQSPSLFLFSTFVCDVFDFPASALFALLFIYVRYKKCIITLHYHESICPHAVAAEILFLRSGRRRRRAASRECERTHVRESLSRHPLYPLILIALIIHNKTVRTKRAWNGTQYGPTAAALSFTRSVRRMN